MRVLVTLDLEVDHDLLADMSERSSGEFDAVAIHLDFKFPQPDLMALDGFVVQRTVGWQVDGEPWDDDGKEPF